MHPSRLHPAEGVKVTILSLQESQGFNGEEGPIRYKFMKDKRGSHLHVYVDGELMGMFSGVEKGTLIGAPPGCYTLELRTVAENQHSGCQERKIGASHSFSPPQSWALL